MSRLFYMKPHSTPVQEILCGISGDHSAMKGEESTGIWFAKMTVLSGAAPGAAVLPQGCEQKQKFYSEMDETATNLMRRGFRC
jgi:hypothetical protein